MSKYKNLIQILKFTMFSISAGIIELVVSAIMYDLLHIDYWISYFVALVLSVIWNFTFNRKYTFKSANNIPVAMTLVFAYYLVFTPLSVWWGYELEKIGMAGILVTIFSMIINFITEFLYQRFVVFRNSIDTNNLAKTEDAFDKIMSVLRKN